MKKQKKPTFKEAVKLFPMIVLFYAFLIGAAWFFSQIVIDNSYAFITGGEKIFFCTFYFILIFISIEICIAFLGSIFYKFTQKEFFFRLEVIGSIVVIITYIAGSLVSPVADYWMEKTLFNKGYVTCRTSHGVKYGITMVTDPALCKNGVVKRNELQTKNY